MPRSTSTPRTSDEIVNIARGDVAVRVRALQQHSLVTPDTVIMVLRYAIEAVSLIKVTGDERRKAIIALVRETIVDAPIHDEHEALLLQMLDLGIIGHVIDLVTSAVDGDLDTGAASGLARGCCVPLCKLWCRRLLRRVGRWRCCSRRTTGEPSTAPARPPPVVVEDPSSRV